MTTADSAIPQAASRRRRGKPPMSARRRAERRLAFWLCAPAVFVMLAVTAYPIGYAIYLSLLKADLRFPGERKWVGLHNYGTVLSSPVWWSDVLHTVIITVVSVSIELVLGMLLAIVMHRAIFGRGAIRTAALVPYGIVTVVAAFAWRFAWSGAEGGFVPAALGLNYDPLDPTHPVTNFLVTIMTEVWKTTPFIALLLLAGLTLVPEELLEAARVDGANAWQRFWKITLPVMKPAILVAVLFRTIDAFRIFDTVTVISNGNNTRLQTVSILGYNQLLNRLNLGLGATVSILIFIIVILIALVFTKAFGLNLDQQRGGT